MSATTSILAGLKVLDVGTFIFGPAAATVLADFGADVIKVEAPGIGDPYRYLYMMPPMPASDLNYGWLLTARNKRSIALDLRHEMGLFELVRGLVDARGLGVLMITHDLNLAARFADWLLLLSEGRAIAAGTPAEVLTQDIVESVFAWPVAMQTIDGRPQMVPLRQSKEIR